ncbi:MAG: 2-nitropropane dioxygenase [Thermoanaerobaculia bacterium]|nr:2-nitropropane dioxygenase [Thermoanaerobaculia bacterium]
MSENIEITCPCCAAWIVVSRESGQVLLHKAPVNPKKNQSLEEMVGEVHAKKSELASRFEKEMASQKDREKILEEKFKEALSRAKKED